MNHGAEFQFNIHAVNTNAVKFDIRLNGGHYTNIITKMPTDNAGNIMTMNGSMSLGHAMYDWYIPEYRGVDPETGYGTYTMFYDKTELENDGFTPDVDENGNAVFSAQDEARYSITSVHNHILQRYVTPEKFATMTPEEQENVINSNMTQEQIDRMLKNPEEYLGTTITSNYTSASSFYVGKKPDPILQGGIGFDLSVYGVELSASFTYSLGGWGYDSAYATLMHDDRAGSRNWHSDIENRWRSADQPGDGIVPKLTNGSSEGYYASATSTRFLTSTNYLSLANVRLGYSFPKKMIEKIKLNNLTLWVSGDNLFALTARKGYYPMASFTGGSSTYQYTPLSTVMGGIRISF